jgi:hydrogenase/urease accessory protein HupE
LIQGNLPRGGGTKLALMPRSVPTETTMNLRKTIQRAVIGAASLAAAAAWAHPNHADANATASLLHLLTEPDHLLAILAAVGVVAWAIRRNRGSRGTRRD